MRRTALIILGVAAGITVLVLLAAAIAVATVDPRALVAPVQARIKAMTGRELDIAGPVELKLSLEPSVVLGDVSFGNARWGRAKEMVRARRIEARVALLPLIRRRFEVVELVLEAPVIALETDPKGRGNWEFGTAAGAAVKAPAAAGDAAGAMAAIGIANLVVNHGAVSWRDGASGRTTEIAVDRMSLHARDFTSPMAVDFSGKVNGIPVALSGNLGPAEALLARHGPYPVAVAGQVDGTSVKLSTKLAQSGNTTTLDALDATWGSIAVRGSLTSVSTAGGTRYVFALDIPSLSLAGGGSSAAASSASAKGAAGSAKWVIPDTPLPLGAVAALDADGSVSIGQVELRGGQRVGKVDARIVSHGGRLDLQVSSGAALGGSLTGDVAFDADGGPRSLRLRIFAQGVDLKALAAAAGNTGDIGGGALRASVDVAGTGTTPRRFASSMSGNILAVAGPTTLTGAVGGAESTLSQVTGLLDPLHAARKATELRCAVLRLPIVGGVARVDRSIAAETDDLGVSASGTIDFRNETFDLALQPQLRQGTSIDVSRIAGLVRVRGPFAQPRVAVDAAQSAQAIASLGILAGKGGGLAALGRALVAPSAGKVEPCAVAISGAAAPAPAVGSGAPAASAGSVGLPGDLGKAIGKLFGR
ncbi:MAG TPA: AsmA family protein [Casimicrobiaceae bacterium]|nr:AsmA family protein [Casimicrobiaceae bacterium]